MALSKILSHKTIRFAVCCHRHAFKSINDSKRLYSAIVTNNLKCSNRAHNTIDKIVYRSLSVSPFKLDPSLTFSGDSTTPQSSQSVDTNAPQSIDLSGFVVPEPPLSPPITDEAFNVFIDVPITELHLASNWTPIGWSLHFLDFLHQTFPWWASIAIATFIMRMCLTPLVIIAHKNAAKMSNIYPHMQLLQSKMNQSRLSGNQLEFAKYSHDLNNLMKKNGIKPFKSLLVPLAQAPVFISYFLCLKRMANLPVESLITGGIFWFVDLSIPDPLYMLPVLTCATLWATLELGVESGMNPNASIKMKYFFRALPFIMFPFIMNFPSAILVYWFTNNTVSFCQVAILKVKPIRELLKIAPIIKYKPEELPVKPKGFVESVKESIDNAKIARKLVDRQKLDDINFKKAAIGPIKKTYKYDPTSSTKINVKN